MLSIEPTDLWTAVAVAGLAFGAVLAAGRVPRVDVSDYVAVPASAALFAAVLATLLTVNAGAAVGDFGRWTPAVMLYVYLVAFLSPFLGWELFDIDDGDGSDASTAGDLFAEAGVAGTVAVGVLVGGVVARLLVGGGDAVGILISTPLFPALFGVGVRVALLPFFAVESLLSG